MMVFTSTTCRKSSSAPKAGIYALSTEGGRQIFKTARQIHLDERLFHAAFSATIPLNDGSLERYALEPGYV